MSGLSLLPLALAIAGFGVSIYAASANWIAWLRARRGGESGSPILVVAPLFAFLGGGLLARAWPEAPHWALWGPGVAMLVLDPAALPLVVMLVKSRR